MDNTPCSFWNLGRHTGFDLRTPLLPLPTSPQSACTNCFPLPFYFFSRILLVLAEPSLLHWKLECIVCQCWHLLPHWCYSSPLQFFCIEFHEQHLDWVSTWARRRPPTSNLIIASKAATNIPPIIILFSLSFSLVLEHQNFNPALILIFHLKIFSSFSLLSLPSFSPALPPILSGSAACQLVPPLHQFESLRALQSHD